MRPLRPLLLALCLVLALAVPASAQESSPSAGSAAASNVSVSMAQGLRDRGRQYFMRGQEVTVNGTVNPYAAGQTAKVELFRSGNLIRTLRAPVTRRGDRGAFVVRFTAGRLARFTVKASVEDPAADPAAPVDTATRTAYTVVPRPRRGGRDTRLLQRGLAALGFVNSRSGHFDRSTGRAVLAFRKTNKMRRVTSSSNAVMRNLFRGEGGFRLRYPKAGKHVEYDWSRQVLVLARGGKPERIYHSSSGHPSTPTVFGRFRFYRRQWGTNAKGMVHSIFFIRGYAIHGYKSVPTYPASHGCLRVPIPNARSIARWVSLGDRIFVYR